MPEYTVSHREKADKKRSMRISLYFHAMILVFCMVPIVASRSDQPQKFEQVIEIRFEDSARKKSGQTKATRKPQATRKKVSMNALSKPKPILQRMEAASVRELVTTMEPEFPVPLPKIPAEQEEIDAVEELIVESPPEPVVFEEIVETSEEEEEVLPDADYDWMDGVVSDDANKSDGLLSDASESGASEGLDQDGLRDKVDGDPGHSEGYGNDGESMQWGEFPGDGLFNRKVIERADVGSLAEEEGRIVIKLCVDQAGKVIYTAFDNRASSIRRGDLITRAEQTAASYVFEPDVNAPHQQCGKLTFIFEFE